MPFIPELLAKLTVILAVGLIAAASLRSLSPSLRHLILFATLAMGLALPLAMLMSPQWNVPVLPRTPSAAVSPNTEANPLGDPRVLTSATNSRPSSPALTADAIDANAGQSPSASLDFVDALPILWALGFIAVIAWLAMGRLRLHRIVKTSWPLDSSDWSSILDETRGDAGVTKPVLLFSSSIVSTPLTWGSRAPVILLPEDALDWPEAHRRIVLRHELAHIARGDSLTQLVAGFVCALYWFHPLVWMTERRLRAECERACDDTVVSLGTPPAEYAAHLLEVARSARAFGAPGFLSVAMARPSQLEGRLLAVLSESRRRVSLSRGARPAAALLSALVLMPFAAFRVVPKADRPAKSAASEASTAKSSSPLASRKRAADTTFQLSTPAQSAGTLTLDLKTGGKLIVTGWDRPEIVVRASLGGRDWRDTKVRLVRSGGDARLESEYTGHSQTQNSRHLFEISVPRDFNVRLKSAGGGISITGVNGEFTGVTGGGEINLRNSSGQADLRTGGGDIHVWGSHMTGTVSTGGGIVRIEGDAISLTGKSGRGPVIYTGSGGGATIRSENGANIVGVQAGSSSSSIGIGVGSGSGRSSTVRASAGYDTNNDGVSTTTTYINDGVGKSSSFAMSGIRMSSGGGAISLPSAPDGAHVSTGGGRIRIGPSNGEVYASTGGGPIDIGPATGSVEAHTGAGDVTIELKGAGAHSVDVTSGKGQVVLVLPRDLRRDARARDGLHEQLRTQDAHRQRPAASNDRDTQLGRPRRNASPLRPRASGHRPRWRCDSGEDGQRKHRPQPRPVDQRQRKTTRPGR